MSEARIDAGKAAELLGISKASVRNWIKHHYLTPIDPAGKQFFLHDVLRLKGDIESGKIDRLRQRANKTGAKKTFMPDEYLRNKANYEKVSHLVEYIVENDIDTGMAIFLLAANLFIINGDVLTPCFDRIETFRPELFRRNAVLTELKEFYQDVNMAKSREAGFDQSMFQYLIDFDLPKERDILGIIYQSLLHEGKKSSLGSYFTPTGIVSEMVKDNYQSGWKALDPCCGTGQFLLAFADFVNHPEDIIGFDIDPIAVRIARCNLLYRFPQDFVPQVFYQDTLTGLNLRRTIDPALIATNPPWGAEIRKAIKAKLKTEFPEITSGESFSYFLLASISLLGEGGTLSFVLPQAVLFVRVHADIRKYILENCQIKKIVPLGKPFKNVLSPVIRMDLAKEKPKGNEEILIQFENGEYLVPQKRFLGNKGYVFDIKLNKKDQEILDKVINTKHITLKNNAGWALGIVTGDNKKFLKGQPSPEYEPVYRGSDIGICKLKKPDTYIRFSPKEFQQAASEEKYRAKEKLIYRFISSSLVFAYDDTGSLTLNSANILIPRLDYPIKAIMALFNSSIYNFFFQKKFTSLKILRGDLEQLPLPLWEKSVLNRITIMVDQILQDKADFTSLDDYIMDQFNLSAEERIYIRSHVGKGIPN
ncbi:MAG: N-6 DNA methylase [Peptococcaceae bacterium]|nr:N-6 DNA methylase [Peptococcaceae bacterium]